MEMTFQKKFMLVIVVFAALTIGWISLDFKSEEIPYVSVSDLIEKHDTYSQDRFRLGGNVEEGSIFYSEDKLTVNFELRQGDSLLPVKHTSAAIPDLFMDGAEVIVEGAYTDGILYADNLMTKCASRYEEEGTYAAPVSEVN